MKSNSLITVETLRKQGYKVRVNHKRNYYHGPSGQFVLRSEKEVNVYEYDIDSFGGYTKVEVTTPDNRELIGEAFCNYKDKFNRKLAVRIALGRALKPQRCSE